MSMTVEARLAILEARDAIAALMSKYLRLVDEQAGGAVIGALFSEDAVWTPLGRLATENREVQGRARLRELFDTLPASLPFTAHYIMNMEIDVAPHASSASGIWQAFELMTLTAQGRSEPVAMVAQYENTFVKEGDEWLISRVRYEDKVSFPWHSDWTAARYVSFADLSIQR